MEMRRISIPAIGFKYGLISFAACAVYFLIMRAVNLIQVPEFRYLNYAILLGGIALALNEVRHTIHRHRINYLPGMGIGLWVSLVCALFFAVFLAIYSSIDKDFVARIKPNLPFQDYVNPLMLAFVAAGEMLVSGVIITFVVMQFFKRNTIGQDNEDIEEAQEGKIFHKGPKQENEVKQTTPTTPQAHR
jgi:drug/metabolite transporter (DMT)-like permease